MYVILACSLAVFAYGVVTDYGRMITGGSVLSSCMVGSLVGDSIRRKEPVSRGLLGGLIFFEVLSLVLMGLFMADYFSPACFHARVCDRTLCVFLHLGCARFGTSLVLLQEGRKGIAWAVLLRRKNRWTKKIKIKQCGTLA